MRRSRIRNDIAISFAALAIAAACEAAVVVERWGVDGRVQHPGAIRYEAQDDGATRIRFDLSALPAGATIHRARLFFTRPGLYGSRFELDPPLPLVPPHFRHFDARAVVRSGSLLLREAPSFDRDATVLEIAYDGELRNPPQQARGIRAFFRSGQVFVTFREIEDYAGGREDIPWKELGKRFRGIDEEGPIPRDDGREIRYRIYEHDAPITAATIGRARLLADVVPGSIYNTRLVPDGDFVAMRPDAIALRLAIEPGKPLPPGTGLHVHTVDRAGRKWYAVVTAIDGIENTTEFSGENVAGPIDVAPGEPEPVLQSLPKAHKHPNAGATQIRDGQVYQEDWYSYWAVPPCATRPIRYDVAAGFCPQTLERPAPLTFTRGHTWGHTPEMPGPEARPGIVMSMSDDPPNGFWTGTNDARDTLKGIEDGVWRPFAQERQEALIRWACRTWRIDPQRIVSSIGAWGMGEIKRADLYACIDGWGMPEVTKGFQCWNWARGAWGPPEAYRGKPDAENPFVLQDYSRWILQDPTVELPYFLIHMGWGAHFTEMGWPPFPRFIRAMMDTKRAFAMCHGGGVRRAIDEGIIAIRRDQSLPAFANCALDDNIGSGELGTGRAFGQINAFLLWETDTIVDRTDAWEMTIWLDGSAPRPECTVDLTPRRCRAFRPKPGERFGWTSGAASGTVTADTSGLVTIPGLAVGKEKRRVRISAVAADPPPAAKRGEASAANVRKGPKIDGTLTDPAWSACPPWPLGACTSGDPQTYATRAKVLFDGANVYVGVRCEEPDTQALLARVTERDGPVWDDDSVEVFLEPDPREPYVQFIANPRGTIYDARDKDPRWDAAVEAKVSIEDGKVWTITLRIPLRDLPVYVGDDQCWTMNICRTRPARGADPTLQYSWAILSANDYHAPREFGVVTGIRIPSQPDGVTRVRSGSAPRPPERGIEKGGVTVYYAMDFDEGPEGWQPANGAEVRQTEEAVSGKALEVRCEKGWAGIARPISIRGSRELKVALRMKGAGLPAAGINVHDTAAGDNTTAYGYRYIREDRWTPILYRLDRFRYNSTTQGTVGPGTFYGEIHFFGPEQARPGRSFAIDDFVIYRGTDREPPAKVTGLRARATADGIALAWDPAEDNVGAAVYVVARADRDGPFAKVAETCATGYADAVAPRGGHRYRILAVDFEENIGPWSDTVAATSTAEPRAPVLSRETEDRPGYAARIREVHARGAGTVRRNCAALFGDSLTGATVYPQCAEAAFGTLIVDAYGYPSMTTRFGRDKIGEILREANPEFLFILYGTNNGKSPQDIERAMEDLAAIAEACEKNGTIPIIGTIPPRGWDPASEPEARYNARVVEMCRGRKTPIGYIFEDWQAAGDRRQYMGDDGVHWKGEGMEIAARAWAKALAQIRFTLRDRE
ncbi:MAG: hypothetical protein JXP34_12840 [Planctomycetes bacterium]|nr:hypothetical protein [Planctomycetota bacterium]